MSKVSNEERKMLNHEVRIMNYGKEYNVGYLTQEHFTKIAEQTVVASKLPNGLIKSSKNHAS